MYAKGYIAMYLVAQLSEIEDPEAPKPILKLKVMQVNCGIPSPDNIILSV